MSTYRYRLRFFINAPGIIQHPEKDFNFLIAGNMKTTLSCLDSDSISKSKELLLSGGGFMNEEEAFNVGNKLKDSLLLSGVKFKIGVDVGKNKSSSMMTNYFKEKLFNEHGIKIIDNVHGLTVYSEEYPVRPFSLSATGSLIIANAEKFSAMLSALYETAPEISDKERLALELYGASHYEKSDRARFITLVLAAEVLLEPRERENSTKEIVRGLIEYTKGSQLGKEEKDSIIGSLRWLYKESISKSLRDMIERHLGAREYGNMIAKKFIDHCYAIRSKLVHTGKVNTEVIHLGKLASQLKRLLSDLLVEMTGIQSI